ncbi:hypothetical protein QBC37DRAFT_430234 [Rhypophila decipiens]|uniref:T6SS Phospholipase effector Tle1-like catalytic domain-containing protein n=1 Tax=Rhypophila decipiens TaxID=261697 RepID=A0AAN7B1S7_9PEZI|nr:hypothetical protein QBC37DRAFT_430234 [Rhypophila decipiens]
MDKSHLAPDPRDARPRGRSTERESASDPHEEYFSASTQHLPLPHSTMPEGKDDARGRRKPRKLVLCFDGTGNKFHGDDSDSNILKIFRMLDRTASDQFHYYQPGIGTYVVSNSLTHTSTYARIKSWYMKAKDSAIGSSFDHHVVGGYRFLMRFYNPGDEIYIFGFSRGAYIARFLAEMLDYCGLLSHGNEEMVTFAWKAFSSWQSRRDNDTEEGIRKRKEMYTFMKGFRETFSRPVRRIRFLGLFDTVNSVPRFETAWMERSKFPYTAKTSAKVIRHAVSIDERRAKFRQDLIYQSDQAKKTGKEHHSASAKMHELSEKYRKRHSTVGGHPASKTDNRGRRPTLAVPEDVAPYRARSRSSRTHRTQKTEGSVRDFANHDGVSETSVAPHPHDDDEDDPAESEDEHDQDIDEVWFAGGHGDIGGGWDTTPGEKPASHIPLAWMVREATKAGLTFDPDKVKGLGCMNWEEEEAASKPRFTWEDSTATQADDHADPRPVPDIMIRAPSSSTPKLFQNATFSHDEKANSDKNVRRKSESEPPLSFKDMMHQCHCARIHDSLSYECGLGWSTVLGWKVMEFLPLRRMDLQPNGEWKPIRWPLPCGEVRDIPDGVRVHGSVIRRMQRDEKYRPGNLIIGGGGRGVRFANDQYRHEDWVCVEGENDPVGEIWMKKKAAEKTSEKAD